MITEDYVSFETAKLLKEKRFNGICETSYNPKLGNVLLSNFTQDSILAPTIQMAMKWLRKTYNLFINVDWDNEDYYFVIITDMIKRDYVKADISGNEYKSYEEACESAIKYCLENLI